MYTFSRKLCMKSFIWEYTRIYDVRYPLSPIKKSGWWNAYAPMVENHY